MNQQWRQQLGLVLIFLLLGGWWQRAIAIVPATAIAPATAVAPTRGTTTIYLPYSHRIMPIPGLNTAEPGLDGNQWLLQWTAFADIPNYTLQESHDITFTAPLSLTTTAVTSTISHPASPDNWYYYRVRANGLYGSGPWSGTRFVLGNYFDDFSDAASGWAVQDNAIVNYAYSNGEYAITTKLSGYLNASVVLDADRDSYTTAADVHWADGSPTDGLYGLVFGVDSFVTQYYFFAVIPNTQQFRLYFFDSSLPVSQRLRVIVPLTTSTAIQSGTAVNHLQATWHAGTITLAINGTELGQWADNAVTQPSRAGLIASPNAANPQTTALFDNFSLNNLPNTLHRPHTPETIPTTLQNSAAISEIKN